MVRRSCRGASRSEPCACARNEAVRCWRRVCGAPSMRESCRRQPSTSDARHPQHTLIPGWSPRCLTLLNFWNRNRKKEYLTRTPEHTAHTSHTPHTPHTTTHNPKNPSGGKEGRSARAQTLNTHGHAHRVRATALGTTVKHRNGQLESPPEPPAHSIQAGSASDASFVTNGRHAEIERR